MPTDIGFPSSNPANQDSLTGLLQFVFGKFKQNELDDMLPARVVAYNRATNRAQVQPLISSVTTLGQTITRAQIASVPVLQLGGGGFVLSFPLVPGDLGWIKANDRDISLFKKSYASAPPNTQRKHDFADALLIPDTMLQAVTIASEDAANAVFQNKSGTVRMALWPTKLKITAPNVGIGNQAGYSPDPNAVLDVHSTTKAFKVPTMTTVQKTAIPSPHVGMVVFDTDEDGLSVYTAGGGWS